MNRGPPTHHKISTKTIKQAVRVGVKKKLIKKLEDTKDSTAPDDVILHRGIQTALKDSYGINSKYYVENCEVIHKYDNINYWTD